MRPMWVDMIAAQDCFALREQHESMIESVQ